MEPMMPHKYMPTKEMLKLNEQHMNAVRKASGHPPLKRPRSASRASSSSLPPAYSSRPKPAAKKRKRRVAAPAQPAPPTSRPAWGQQAAMASTAQTQFVTGTDWDAYYWYSPLIRAVHQRNDPDKMQEVNELFCKHRGSERQWYEAICQKYQEEPKPIQETEPSPAARQAVMPEPAPDLSGKRTKQPVYQ